MIVIGARVSPPVRKGEWEFAFEDVEGVEAIAGMAARCPCGCGAEAFLDFSLAGDRAYAWNGNEQRPTVEGLVIFPCRAGKGVWTLRAGAWEALDP